jgi:diaminohydroxyphosphoribosylaminopyrimidine deaminase/5-amino-6-(5-phosphoribosylamino)uracil reductase
VRALLVEGGGRLAGQLIARGLIDRLELFMAPALMGAGHRGYGDALRVRELAAMPRLARYQVERLGDDVWIRGDLAHHRQE